ncbi:MAG: hypothetical protein M0P61_00485 [Ignavibacteriaceae bacterium]|nr:hypothetical protein [Ignavibacteriaceae bacterium]
MPKISEYTELVTPTDDDLLITVSAGVTKKIKRANFLGKTLNYIGIAGTTGFGVGICPNTLPAGMLPLVGYDVIGHDQYGNYQYSDGSIMVWVPKFYYKVLHDGSTNINKVLIASVYDYENETAANAAGYALHRAFIDGGVIKDGFFIDKYKWSLTAFVNGSAGIASSIKNGNPITSSADANRDASNLYAGSFADCISNSQTPAENYGGAWAAAKSRGNDFANSSMFIWSAIKYLNIAHGQAATSTTNCAWYLTNKNYPKGNNNYGADIDDATCTFAACDDGYWAARNEARKNGSGTLFAKTTHNGQNCGVADLQGDQWQICQGLTAIVSALTIDNVTGDGTYVTIQTTAVHGLVANNWVMLTSLQASLTDKMWKVYDVPSTTTIRIQSTEASITDTAGTLTKGKFYAIKESVSIKDVTGSNTGATDHFGATGVAALMEEVIPNFANGGGFGQLFGNSTNQVLPFNISRTNNSYKLGGLALPDVSGMSAGGTNLFGLDYFYQYLINEMCPILGGYWNDSAGAGVWSVYLNLIRTSSYRSVSGRACLYV